jgi:hypothetical protein
MKNLAWKMAGGQKRLAWLACLILLPSSFCLRAGAQTYSIDWYKVAGGGGTSSGASGGGVYSVSGTIGQQDATSSGALTGGGYSLTGGFWSLIAAVPSAGAPSLAIKYVQPDSVVVSWPASATGYTLQQNSNLAAPKSWVASGYAITTANGTNSITITPPSGNLFFRLVLVNP